MSGQNHVRPDESTTGIDRQQPVDSRKISLLHLKKTSGTSVYRQLRDAIMPELIAPWNAEFPQAKQFSVLGGHYSAENIFELNGTNICFLRDPIGRVVSQYNYVQTLSDFEILRNNDRGATAMRSLKFEDCLESADPAVLKDTSNYYCKSFFGDNYDRSEVFSEDGLLTARAWMVLDHIDFFGFKETFEVSVSDLMGFLGLSQPMKIYKEKDIRNLDKSSRQIDSLKALEALSEKIAALNSDDIALFSNIVARKVPGHAPQPNATLGAFPEARPGYKFNFHGKVDPFINILYLGWYDVEQGVWSRGKAAELAFFNTGDASVISFDIELPLHPNLLSEVITITINARQRYVYHAIRSHASIKVRGMSDNDFVVSIGASGVVRLNVPVSHLPPSLCHVVVSTDNHFVPSAYGDSGDDRELGFKLHGIEIF